MAVPKPAIYPTYPLPDFLNGRCTKAVYTKWLDNKAWTLLRRDKKRGKPYAAGATRRTYKQLIHRADVPPKKCTIVEESISWLLSYHK